MRFRTKKKVDILIDGKGDKFHIGPEEVVNSDGSIVKQLKETRRLGAWRGTYRFRPGEIMEPMSRNKKQNYYIAPMAAVKDGKPIENYQSPIVRLLMERVQLHNTINMLSRALQRIQIGLKQVESDTGTKIGQTVDVMAEINRALRQVPSETSQPFVVTQNREEETV